MKKILTRIRIFIQCQTGIDLKNVMNAFSFVSPNKYRALRKDIKELKKQSEKADIVFPFGRLYPCYFDKNDNAGNACGAYYWQDFYVAQRIFKNKPDRHIDVGSSVSGFITHVACFRQIEVLDIRPLEQKIPNVLFKQCDIMKKEGLQAGITDSISSLHALEHFGLGRYGDPICYDGYLIGFDNITYLLKPGGKFYFSVPLGQQRIEFHAHRIFSLSYLLDIVSRNFTIDCFSYVDDQGDFFPEVAITQTLQDSNCNCYIGCAIFELTKK